METNIQLQKLQKLIFSNRNRHKVKETDIHLHRHTYSYSYINSSYRSKFETKRYKVIQIATES